MKFSISMEDEKDENYEKVRKSSEIYAQKKGFVLNPNKKKLSAALSGLSKNEKNHKFRFCPCRTLTGDFQKDKANICPCKWHLAEIKKDGHCLCGLFFDPKRI